MAAPLSEEATTGSEKVTLIWVATGTWIWLLRGRTSITVGATTSRVVNTVFTRSASRRPAGSYASWTITS
jgi:hypothetical protein